jgi:DNA topoisomerase-3
MKALVLTEKPSVAKDIARVLGCKQKGKGCFIGSKYIVTWALGHLVTLAEPEAYDDKYKHWRLEDLPMVPKRMELTVIKNTRHQYNNVKTLMAMKEVNEIIIATDSGREGELVARWIIEKAGCRKPIKRLWISSQTDKAIKDGFKNLRPGKEYDNLYLSAQCRAEADWLVGLNVTRALTCKYNAQLSAGRVQTPTLAMIVQREEEIKKFVPRDYWIIDAKVPGFTMRWQDKHNGQTRIFEKSRADAIVAAVTGQRAEVVELCKDEKREPAPLAYDLTELQRDANRRFGYSAKKTLSIMQRLYESHKLVTYPRTDSRYITEDIVPTLTDRLKCIRVGLYAPMVARVLKDGLRVTKRLVDNSKVTDHHAIIPTEQYVDLSALSTEERNIYDLIIKRFIAVLSPPFEYEQTTVKLEAGGYRFYAKGKVVRAMGWKAIYNDPTRSDEDVDEDDVDQSLPVLSKGDRLRIISISAINKKTKPPARYTEATLLSAMENAGRFIDDAKLRSAMDVGSGLGTPATRADIIEKLFDTFYLERKGKEIVPTSKGIQLMDLVPPDLKQPELTARWEQQLMLISRGKADGKAFIKDMREYASQLVGSVIASSESYRHDNITRVKCPQCGKFLLEVKGKKGRMMVCQDRECGYRKQIAQLSNARCPQCHKKMEIMGEGEKKIFVCACGYRERLSDFNKRKGEERDNLNKREVSRYLRQQNIDAPINSALADALAKLKK